MKILFASIVIGITIIAFPITASAQESIQEEIPTENIDRKKDSNKRKNRSKVGIREIYKKSSWKTGYGNPCIEEATQKMGFIYAPVVKGQPGYRWEGGRLWHNLWVKLGLIVRRGPWWKIRINKQIKDCRRKSGDIVGP